MANNNTIGVKLKFQNLPGVADNKKLTATEFNQLVDFQNSPVQQISGSLDDTDIVIDGTKNYATTIVEAGATRTITANASGHKQGNNIKQRYTFDVDCTLTLSGFDATGNNTGEIDPILAGTYDFIYSSNRNGINLLILQNINIWVRNGANIFFIGGNVGINEPDPDFPLSIGSSNQTDAVFIEIAGDSGGNAAIKNSGGGSFDIWSDGGDLTLRYNNSGGFKTIGLFLQDSTGNVGINELNPDEKLHVGGNIKADGNILADKLAADVAAQINTGDFGGGVAIGSGVGGIETAPLDGLLLEGQFLAGDGDVGTPGMSFASHSNFGFYATAFGVEWASGGVNGGRFFTSGLLVNSQVAFGTSALVRIHNFDSESISISTSDINTFRDLRLRNLYADGAILQKALSVDPSAPANNSNVKWQSDGTESGDDGDYMMKITDSGGDTKITTLVDFSAI